MNDLRHRFTRAAVPIVAAAAALFCVLVVATEAGEAAARQDPPPAPPAEEKPAPPGETKPAPAPSPGTAPAPTPPATPAPADAAAPPAEAPPRIIRVVCTDRICGNCDGKCHKNSGHVAVDKKGHCACTPTEGSALDRATRDAYEKRPPQ
jgi:hypothetical protein